MVDAWAAAAVAASLFLFLVVLLYGYNAVMSRLYPPLVAQHRVEMLRFIPVVADKGTLVEISAALVAAMIPLHLYTRRLVRRSEKLEDQMADFLAVYASIAASSRSTADALLRAARLLGPPLSLYIEKMARVYMVTGNLDLAYREAFGDAPRRVRLLARSIVTVTRSGGNPARVLSVTAAYSRELRRLSKMIRNRLGEYGFVVALASITFAVSAGVVLYLVATMAGAKLPGLGSAKIQPGLLAGLYYYSLLMITAASSIVIARVIHGYTALAPKYFAILLAISTAAFIAAPLLLAGQKIASAAKITAKMAASIVGSLRSTG